ncbi:phytanoyl-CoA dioxygenase family protein [Roseivirga sp.]|uniref:phytanoyl-CoA dioxygenase family protein n=1 Tax=Roseivirga sp. TaxID=1964215 RepID=UPI003B8C4E42
MGSLLAKKINKFEKDGFTILKSVFSDESLSKVSKKIDTYISKNQPDEKKSFYAIRHLFKEIPELIELILTPTFKNIIEVYAGKDYFISKAIYFSKPLDQNWFVSYHQDLSINVKNYTESKEYKHWIERSNSYSVRPYLEILQKTITLRIHIDTCNESSGSLKVLSGSHLSGVKKSESIHKEQFEEKFCNANTGDVLLMKPLLFHASNKTTIPNRRRIIHIELCNKELKDSLEWFEKISF